MRKKILLMLSLFCFMGASLMAQTNNIEGGAGVIFVDGNPNLNADLIDVSVNEGHVAYDRDNQVVYFFNPGGVPYNAITATAGDQWIPVDVNAVNDPVTSVDIAAGSPELTVNQTTGDVEITFSSSATLTYDAATQMLQFTDTDGTAEPALDLSALADLAVVQATSNSITVTGTGTSGDPYEVSITGFAGATNGQVPVADGAGNLNWTSVVSGIAVQPDGTIDITTTDGTTTQLDLAGIPEVRDIHELNAAAGSLGMGEEGLVRAAEFNTFGLTATSDVGVLFFISN